MSTETSMMTPESGYPVRFDVEYPDKLSRLLNNIPYLKGVLLIPHIIVLLVMWFTAGVLGFIAWWAILFTARYPRGLFDFVVNVQRWGLNINSYYSMLRDEYPPFTGDDGKYPVVSYSVEYPDRLSRLLNNIPYLKSILLIPHIVVLIFLSIGSMVVSFIAWWAILFTGKYPRGLFDYSVGVTRWLTRVSAYSSMLTDAYPPFSLKGAEPTAASVALKPEADTSLTTAPISGEIATQQGGGIAARPVTADEGYIALATMGSGFANAKIPSVAGEHVIRCQAGHMWNRIFLPEEDGLLPPVLSRAGGLVLTNKRLLWVRPKMPVHESAKVWLEIPLGAVESARATHMTNLVGFVVTSVFALWVIFAPVYWLVLALTKRLEVAYSDGTGRRLIRLHASNASAWAKDIREVSLSAAQEGFLN